MFNSIQRFLDNSQRTFLQWGWLIPALLPITQVGGRAAYYNLSAIYFLWGITTLIKQKKQLDNNAVWIQILLLGTFFLAMPFAHDSWRAFDKWVTFGYQTIVFPLTYIVLKQKGEEGLARLLHMMAVCGLITLGLLFVQLIFHYSGDYFTPSQQLKEDLLPFLLPCILAFLMTLKNHRRWFAIFITVAIFLYIIISGGRSALFGFLIALIVFSLLNRDWVIKRILITVSVGLLFSVITNADSFLRSAQNMPTLTSALDMFTSLRTLIWRQAIENPPDSMLIGIGMGNIRYVPEVIQVGNLYLGHLHNFILDSWYETGFLGLTMLLIFIAYPLLKLRRAWKDLYPSQRFYAGVWVAAMSAILSAGLLSFAYSSAQFAMFLPLALAVILYIANSNVSAEQGREFRTDIK